ncbi:hypothetical protein GCM10010276_23540 [Streptomyces longisporus]|uniref:Uncharacterized protein n=1 Tax=Streptomyces longisporus TaxID=1948 RepID=A0ABP5YSK1_STRLO
MHPAVLDVGLDQVVCQRLHLACGLGCNGEKGEPVRLFLSAGAVGGVASAVDFRDEIVQVWPKIRARTPNSSTLIMQPRHEVTPEVADNRSRSALASTAKRLSDHPRAQSPAQVTGNPGVAATPYGTRQGGRFVITRPTRSPRSGRSP